VQLFGFFPAGTSLTSAKTRMKNDFEEMTLGELSEKYFVVSDY